MTQIRGFKRVIIQSLDTWLLSTLRFFDYFLRLAGPAFACVAVVLISGVIWAWFSFVLPNIAAPGTLLRYCHVAVAIFLIVNVFFNYFKTLFTPPGQPPDDYGINLDIEGGVNEETKHWDGFGRFCKKCRKPKPPRTHHCSICRKCARLPDVARVRTAHKSARAVPLRRGL